MSTYSIRYGNVDFPYGDRALDWNWMVRDAWARSDRQGPSSPWIPQEGLDEKAHEILLAHFGIAEWAEEFPPKRIISMSPRELAGERRRREGNETL